MTTLVEVKHWTRPFLARHPDFTQIDRLIVLPVVDHFIRGFFVDRTSIKQMAVVYCFADPLYEMHYVPAFFWSRRLDVPPSDQPDFQQQFEIALEDGLRLGLGNIASIEDFVEQTSKIGSRFFGPSSLPNYNGRYGRALAALGRLHEAEPLLAQDLIDDPVSRRAANPDMLARYFDIGPDSLERHAYHTQLLALVREGDSRGIAALLRDCEKFQAERWKVRHLWKPTAFPVEELA